MSNGDKFNRLEAIRPYGRNKQGGITWLFKCDCGNTKVIYHSEVKIGRIKSCGCLNDELRRKVASKYLTTHGMSNTPTYSTWNSMLNRCTNPNVKKYSIYGGRGIKVCRRWYKFENFLKDMGEKPDDMSIDRINNNGDYKPSNCKWSTRIEQAYNRRTNVLFKYQRETYPLKKWADMKNIPYKTLWHRINVGWDFKTALESPINSFKKEV